MRASLTLTVRLGVMLTFLALMPVLALPQVNRWVDEKFLGIAAAPRKTADLSSSSLSTANKEVASAANDSKKVPSPQANDVEFSSEKVQQVAASLPTDPVERLTPTENEIDNDRFHELQGRLQRLGVQYLVLEKWPGADAQYRFHCRMAVPGSSAYARPFEARDNNPLRAMQQVLADVETWCASHSTTTSSKLR